MERQAGIIAEWDMKTLCCRGGQSTDAFLILSSLFSKYFIIVILWGADFASFCFSFSWNIIGLQCCVTSRVQQSYSYTHTHTHSHTHTYIYRYIMLLLLLLSRFSHVWLCVTPEMAAHQAPPSLGFSRQEHWSGLPFPSPMHESEKSKWNCSVMSDS